MVQIMIYLFESVQIILEMTDNKLRRKYIMK